MELNRNGLISDTDEIVGDVEGHGGDAEFLACFCLVGKVKSLGEIIQA